MQGDPNGPNLGEWRNALGNYQAALSIWEQQFRSAPADHQIHSRWWRTFVKTGMKLHDLGDQEAYRLHIRSGQRLMKVLRPRETQFGRRPCQCPMASRHCPGSEREPRRRPGWMGPCSSALELVVKQHPDDAHLRDEFLVLLHATVLALGNHADPGSELRVSETVMRSLEEVTSASSDRQSAGDFGLILTIRGRALVASGESGKALECYRKALQEATALLERSARNPLAGFVLASVLLEFTSTFRSEPAADALSRYRKYLDAARDSSAADPVNAEARGTLYARLSDMAEILDSLGDGEAAEFHRQAALVAGDLGTQLAQGRPVSTEWGARQRFYHFRAADSPADAAGLLGLRFSVLQMVQGAWVEVDPAKAVSRRRSPAAAYRAEYRWLFLFRSPGLERLVEFFLPCAGDLNAAWSKQPMFLPARLCSCSTTNQGPSRSTSCFRRFHGRNGWRRSESRSGLRISCSF